MVRFLHDICPRQFPFQMHFWQIISIRTMLIEMNGKKTPFKQISISWLYEWKHVFIEFICPTPFKTFVSTEFICPTPFISFLCQQLKLKVCFLPYCIFKIAHFSYGHNHPWSFHKFRSLWEIILHYSTIILLGFTPLTMLSRYMFPKLLRLL